MRGLSSMGWVVEPGRTLGPSMAQSWPTRAITDRTALRYFFQFRSARRAALTAPRSYSAAARLDGVTALTALQRGSAR